MEEWLKGRAKLVPKLFTMFREGYSSRSFLSDLTAGVIVGIVALPLAIAFAIASGVTPEQGLFTAIVAGFLISRARRQPRADRRADRRVHRHRLRHRPASTASTAWSIATFMAGVLLIVMGLSPPRRASSSSSPTRSPSGFTSGIALIIFSSPGQGPPRPEWTHVPRRVRREVGGLRRASPDGQPGRGRAWRLAHRRSSSSLWPRVSHRVPGPLVAHHRHDTGRGGLLDLPVETIGTRFGDVPRLAPRAARCPHLDWQTMREPHLRRPSPSRCSAAIESLLSAVVADGMIGCRHHSNMELVAQGVANIALADSSAASPPPAPSRAPPPTSRTAAARRSPASSTPSRCCSIMLFFGKWAALIPMATLAAILIVVAYNMSEWRVLRAPVPTAPRATSSCC